MKKSLTRDIIKAVAKESGGIKNKKMFIVGIVLFIAIAVWEMIWMFSGGENFGCFALAIGCIGPVPFTLIFLSLNKKTRIIKNVYAFFMVVAVILAVMGCLSCFGIL